MTLDELVLVKARLIISPLASPFLSLAATVLLLPLPHSHTSARGDARALLLPTAPLSSVVTSKKPSATQLHLSNILFMCTAAAHALVVHVAAAAATLLLGIMAL